MKKKGMGAGKGNYGMKDEKDMDRDMTTKAGGRMAKQAKQKMAVGKKGDTTYPKLPPKAQYNS